MIYNHRKALEKWSGMRIEAVEAIGKDREVTAWLEEQNQWAIDRIEPEMIHSHRVSYRDLLRHYGEYRQKLKAVGRDFKREKRTHWKKQPKDTATVSQTGSRPSQPLQ